MVLTTDRSRRMPRLYSTKLWWIPLGTALERHARLDMAQVLPEAEDVKVEITRLVGVGSPYHKIVAVAEAEQADLIVMATHGRTGFSHVVMGSVAERVVRLAPCPVLTVHATA